MHLKQLPLQVTEAPKDKDGQQSKTGDTSANQDMEASVDQLCSAARKGDVTDIESLLSGGL